MGEGLVRSLQPWDILLIYFFGRNDAKAEAPVLWPPHAKSWLTGKDSDAGRDWGQEEKGTTEDEMAGWHHRLDGYESGWNLGVGDGQGGPACCDSWGHKESDTTERLNWTECGVVYVPFKAFERRTPTRLSVASGSELCWSRNSGRVMVNRAILWLLRRERIRLQSRRPKFDPWVEKISWRRE